MGKIFDDVQGYIGNKGTGKTHIVNIELPSSIDARKVKCSCGEQQCKVGLNFDDNVMLLTNKFGNETVMQLNIENIDEIIEWLKQIRRNAKIRNRNTNS
jgi:hypothetical protein